MKFFALVALSFCFCSCSVTAQEPKTITNSIGMKLVLIPKGTFLMGSPPTEEGSDHDERQHEVTLTQDYYLGAFEVTQAQYEKVMGENPSQFQGYKVAERHPDTGQVVKDVNSSNHPVERVSWEDAVEFCQKLSALPEEKRARRVYRLPTEAQWEYACRAGSKTAYSFGASSRSLGDYAWIVFNSDSKTHPVGKKKPNAWGLYDMHGNVVEWCNDWYGNYPNGRETDPTGPESGSFRIARGGGWRSGGPSSRFCRSANRFWLIPSSRVDSEVGFRITCVPSGQ